MIFKKIKLFDRSNSRLIRKKLGAEHLSSEIGVLVRCTQARINLFRGLTELNPQLGIDDESEQLNMLDKGTLSYRDRNKLTQ